MNDPRSPVQGGTAAPRAFASSFDGFFGLGGLVVAVASILVGLVAQGTGSAWLVWTASGLVALGLVGTVRNSIRHLLAYERQPGFGWFIASWIELLIGLQLAVFALGDPNGPVQRAAPLRRLLGPEMVALPSVIIGVALGLTSIGLLRGRLRVSAVSSRLASGVLAAVGVGITTIGVLAWLSPATTADLKLEAEVRLVGETGIFQVLESEDASQDEGDVRPYSYEGTDDPAIEDWDQWVVVSVVEGDEGAEGYEEKIEILYGPATAEAAWEYSNRTMLFQGTEDQIEAWVEDQGSTYKDYLAPSLLIWMGVLFVASAFTLAPLGTTTQRNRVARP